MRGGRYQIDDYNLPGQTLNPMDDVPLNPGRRADDNPKIRYDPAQSSGGLQSSRYDAEAMRRLDADEDFALAQLEGQRRGRNKGSAAFYWCIGIAALTAAVFGAMLAIRQGRPSENESSATDISSSVQLVDMTHACTPEYLATVDGRYECKKACEDAQCCHLDDNEPGSCRPGNEDLCWEYSVRCKILEEEENENGTDADVEADTADDVSADTETENAGSGAGGVDDSGVGVNSDTGIAAEKGSTPVAEVETLPPAPIDLEDRCLEENKDSCRAACELASCCFRPEDDPDGCFLEFEEACTLYQPCTVVIAIDSVGREDQGDAVVADMEVPYPPVDLADMCMLEDKTACKEVCNKASLCCEDKDCFLKNEAACTLYEPCDDFA